MIMMMMMIIIIIIIVINVVVVIVIVVSSSSSTIGMSVVGSNPVDGFRCLLEQEPLTSLRSTGWSQELILA